MAKPTKRERKEEAKRRRLEEMKRRQKRARMRKMYRWVALLVVLALIGLWISLARASSSRAKNRLRTLAVAAGCDVPKTSAEEGNTHVQQPPTYRTNPPTSGNHFGATIRTGIYSEAPPDANIVHNMEHGHVVMWYLDGQVGRPTLEELAKVVRENPTRIILAPRATMQDNFKIAFTAWHPGEGVMQGCASPTTPKAVGESAREFVKQHVGDGPERDIPGQAGETRLPAATPPPSSPTPSPSPGATGTASPSPSPSPSVTATALPQSAGSPT